MLSPEDGPVLKYCRTYGTRDLDDRNRSLWAGFKVYSYFYFQPALSASLSSIIDPKAY